MAPSYVPQVGDIVAYHGVPSKRFRVTRVNSDGSIVLAADNFYDVPHRSEARLVHLVIRDAS